MYRTRVEAVSGLKVCAGGKWLTCIGNRVVRVGDLIWTDGRCVYGHDREAQTPLVIVPQKEDWAIPIQVRNSLYTYRKGELELVGEMPKGLRLLNNKQRDVYGLTADAANCTGSGDIYTLKQKGAFYGDNLDISNIPKISISVTKNNTTVSEIQLTDLVKNVIHGAMQLVSSVPLFDNRADGIYAMGGDNAHVLIETSTETNNIIRERLLYSMIEDEKSWAFIYYVSALFNRYRMYSVDGTGEASTGPQFEFEPFYLLDDARAHQAKVYYIDSKGTNKVIYQHHGTSQRVADYIVWGIPVETPPFTEFQAVDISDMQNIKFPLQDEFYFKATILPADENPISLMNHVPTAKHDIYSPSDSLLFSCEELLGGNFVITKLKADKYLVGRHPLGSHLKEGTYVNESGLYICEDGELTALTETGGDFRCRNYLLRPMKKYKHWWERIQTID